MKTVSRSRALLAIFSDRVIILDATKFGLMFYGGSLERHMISLQPTGLSLVGITLCIMLVGCSSHQATVPVTPRPSTLDFQWALPAQPAREADLTAAVDRLAAQPQNPDAMREAGVLYQVLSPPDRWHYLDRAIAILDVPALRDDPVSLMYMGLSKAAKARDPDVGLLSKLGLARAGFASMDRAVALAADNYSLRLLRAKAGLLAPGVLGRGQLVAEDRAYVEIAVRRGDLPVHLQAMGLIFLGDAQDRVEKDRVAAQALWRQASSLDTPYAAMARTRLGGEAVDFDE